jgi:hypothetical protein
MQLSRLKNSALIAAGASSLLPSQLAVAAAGDTIRPFRVDVPDE